MKTRNLTITAAMVAVAMLLTEASFGQAKQSRKGNAAKPSTTKQVAQKSSKSSKSSAGSTKKKRAKGRLPNNYG